MKSCRASALNFAVCSRSVAQRFVAAGLLTFCLAVFSMRPAPSWGRTEDAQTASASAQEEKPVVHVTAAHVKGSYSKESSAKPRKVRRTERNGSPRRVRENPEARDAPAAAKRSAKGGMNQSFYATESRLDTQYYALTPDASPPRTGRPSVAWTNSAVALRVRIPASSPAKRSPVKTGGVTRSVSRPAPEPQALPGFAAAPLRVGQVTAKVTEAGSVEMASGGVLRARESVLGNNAVAHGAGAADSPKGSGCLRIAASGEGEQLADATLRPQVAAKAIYRPDFALPAALRSQKLDAKVTVRVRVAADGGHTESVLSGSGLAELDAALLPYLRRWRWEPAQNDGAPVASILRITLPIKTE